MKPLVAFVTVLVVVLGLGSLLAWRERARGEAADEVGSTTATLPLALVEGKLVVLHPLFLGGLVVSTGLSLAIGFVFFRETEVGDIGGGLFFALLAVSLGLLGLVLASNRSAGRARRDGTDELLRSLPTAPRAHTAAQLIGGWMAAVVVLATGALVMGAQLLSVDGLEPLTSVPAVAGLVVVIGLGATVVGVLLARWLPLPLAGAAGVVVIVVLNNQFDQLHPRWRWLRVAPEPDFGGIFDVKPYTAHLLFVAGLVVLGAGLALARHGLRPTAVATVGVGAVVVGFTGWSTTRPPSESEVATRAAMLTDPETHQTCRDHEGVRYCAYPEYATWIPTWRAAVGAVLAATPPVGRPEGLAVVQRPAPALAGDLLPEVAAAIDPTVVWRQDGVVHPTLQLSLPRRHVEVGYQAAAAVVGLPPAIGYERLSCNAGGQARSLVAWWLAAHAGDDVRAWLAEKGADAPNSVVLANTIPDYDGTGEFVSQVGSSGRAGDVAGALALLDLPDERVRASLGAHWDEVRDPATSSGAVFGWLGLPVPKPVATVVRVELRACRT